MPAHTVMLDFSVDPTLTTNAESCVTVTACVCGVLCEYGFKSLQSLAMGGECERLEMLTGPHASTAIVRSYTSGLITATLEYPVHANTTALFDSYKKLGELERQIKEKLSASSSKLYWPVRRGEQIDQYLSTSDERIQEYDFDAVLFEQKSEFQLVQILHSPTMGNALILDHLINLAECDIDYTESLMHRSTHNYSGQEVLILGGGDGALLYELLKENTKHVTMIDIDEMVITSCREHLRSVCGDVMDTYKTDKYEIIIDDAIMYMDRYQSSGTRFDVVFGDLTDVPISDKPEGELWDFLRKVTNKAINLLKPGGVYMTHGNGAGSVRALELYEQHLSTLPVTYERSEKFVPSFMEKWVFYKVKPTS